MTHKGRPVVCC